MITTKIETGRRPRLTYSPKDNRVELKVPEDATAMESMVYNRIAHQVETANKDHIKFTLRGEFFQPEAGVYVICLKSQNKQGSKQSMRFEMSTKESIIS